MVTMRWKAASPRASRPRPGIDAMQGLCCNNEVILFTTPLYNAIASRVLRSSFLGNASASYSIDAPPTGSLQHVKCFSIGLSR